MRTRNFLRAIQEFLVEPFLLAFALFVIFPHVQTAYNATMAHLKDMPKFIASLCEDMKLHPAPFIYFGIILLLWLGLKAYRICSDTKSEKELREILTNLPQKIAEALKTPSNTSQSGTQNIGDVNKEIREHLRKLNERKHR